MNTGGENTQKGCGIVWEMERKRDKGVARAPGAESNTSTCAAILGRAIFQVNVSKVDMMNLCIRDLVLGLVFLCLFFLM